MMAIAEDYSKEHKWSNGCFERENNICEINRLTFLIYSNSSYQNSFQFDLASAEHQDITAGIFFINPRQAEIVNQKRDELAIFSFSGIRSTKQNKSAELFIIFVIKNYIMKVILTFIC